MVALPWTYWLFLSSLALGALLGLVAVLGGDHDAGDGDDGELTEGLLSLLGFGRIPLGALLTIDLLLFGGIGIVSTELLGAILPRALATAAALPLALVLAPLLGARLARVLGRRLPGLESHGVSRYGLVGRLGKAELRVDAAFGRAHVVDDGGALHQVRCITRGEPIERGAELVLLELDEATGSYVVERADFSARH
ncbi:MAG TPA: hypothetical protein VM686_00010 [Polyangiaceae bacterium]|nr:hypothetical protein [Polyangiaceae bacterium]